MEDRRIIKTKRNIKSSFIELLDSISFEKLSVAELCRRAETSRITFYTYYEDKYTLVNEMFSDYIKEADADYHRMQLKNNTDNSGVRGYENLLECILNLYFNNINFFKHTTPQENPYLFSVFFNHFSSSVEDYLVRHTKLVSRYPIKQTASLLCNGIWGVICVCNSDRTPQDDLRKSVRSMYGDILESRLFAKA